MNDFGVVHVGFVRHEDIESMKPRTHPLARIPHYYWRPQDPEDESADLAANLCWRVLSKEKGVVL